MINHQRILYNADLKIREFKAENAYLNQRKTAANAFRTECLIKSNQTWIDKINDATKQIKIEYIQILKEAIKHDQEVLNTVTLSKEQKKILEYTNEHRMDAIEQLSK